MKTCLRNFLVDRARAEQRVKRGGGVHHLALEDGDGGLELPDPGGASPEECLDAEWRRGVFARALEELEQELRAGGRDVAWEVFRAYFVDDEELDYAALAARHGITKADVSNHLQRAKERFRGALRRVVIETVGDDDELRAELAWVFEPRGGRA